MPKVKKASFALGTPQMTILSDQPSRSSADDFLRMESRLAVVLDILRHKSTRCPITIAIYGDWGTGKTSAMHWLESELKEWNDPKHEKERGEHPRVYSVWFDPWKYQSREEVWRGIIAEVILALFDVGNLDKKNFVPRMKEAAKQFGAFLGKGFLHALAHMKVNVGAAEISGEMFQDIYEEYDKTNRPEKAYLNQFENTLKHWVRSFLKENERITLFIDDLDRCMPDVTLEVLEAIKLYLNIPQIMFVVGVDREVVDKVVIKHYQEHGVEREKARQYLDKIFQVEIHIPPSEQQMKEFLDKEVAALNESTGGYWKQKLTNEHRSALEIGIRELARHNPRETKRLLNNALFRGRAATDNPDLCEKFDESILFAQGVQLFLVQRIIQNWISNGHNLLREDEALEWFEKWSISARKFPDFRPPVRETGGDIKLSREKEQPQSEADKEYEELNKVRLTGDDLKAVDKLLLLEDNLLWQLLRIPFSVEVAQSATKLEEVKPALGVPQAPLPQTNESVEISIEALSSVLHDRIAKQLRKPVNQLTSSDLRDIKDLDLNGAEISNSELLQLTKLTGLGSLNLNGTQITDDGVAHLAKLTALTSLNLNRTKITEEGLAHLSKLASLKDLHLYATQTIDSGLTHLVKMSALTSLNLGLTQITDAGLPNLIKLTGLQRLWLHNTKITDSGLPHLAKLTNLTSLTVGISQITDNGLAHLSKLTELTNLNLGQTRITDDGLAYLSNLTKLTGLILYDTQITDAGLAYLSKLTELTYINLVNARITDVGLAHLAKFKKLTSMTLIGTQITDKGLSSLGSLTNLNRLWLPNKISKIGLDNLKKQLANVEILTG